MSATASATAITLKNILVATDLSAASLRSLPFVIAISREYGSTIYLAHVIRFGTFKVARPESFDAVELECRDYASGKLNRLSSGVRAEGVARQTLIGEGDVPLVICDWVDHQRIDLLAVGTSGRTGLRKLALGSVAEELIRAAPCPVMTFGPSLPPESPACIRRILLATDFSPSSMHAGLYACSMARRYDADLIILHVTPKVITQGSRRSLIRQLRDLVPGDSDLAIRPEELIAQGHPAAKILEIADEHGVDLIAMGVRGSGTSARASSHFGSTAHDVVVGAKSPVLVVGTLHIEKKRVQEGKEGE